MKKTKQFKFDATFLDKIASSSKMWDSEKMNFLKYVAYMTRNERMELLQLI